MLIEVTLDMTINKLEELASEINKTNAGEYLDLRNLNELKNPGVDVWANIKNLWNVRDHLIEFNTTVNHHKVDVDLTLKQVKEINRIIDSLTIHIQKIISEHREHMIRENLDWYVSCWNQKWGDTDS